MNVRAIGLAVAAGIVATGCGSSTASDGHAGSTPDGSTSATPSSKASDKPASDGGPCDLVSDDAVTAVLHIAIVRREPHGEAGSPSVSCIKGAKRANDPSRFSYVSVAVVGGGGVTLLDQFKSQAGSTPVAGLGDRAIYVPGVGGVFIADGDDALQVQIVKGGKPGSRADCVTIAKDVLSRRH
jgi:hypothetical protein